MVSISTFFNNAANIAVLFIAFYAFRTKAIVHSQNSEITIQKCKLRLNTLYGMENLLPGEFSIPCRVEITSDWSGNIVLFNFHGKRGCQFPIYKFTDPGDAGFGLGPIY